MIKDIISFVTANQKFAIDFQKTPIILRAKEYLNQEKIKNIKEIEKVYFEGEVIDVVDLAHILKLGRSSLLESSRLLVGEIEGKMYGFLVDKVIEIINLNGETLEMNNSMQIEEFIEISGEKLRLIDLKLILKNSNFKIIVD
jgi:purine-binding chemotaxis protein CheW